MSASLTTPARTPPPPRDPAPPHLVLPPALPILPSPPIHAPRRYYRPSPSPSSLSPPNPFPPLLAPPAAPLVPTLSHAARLSVVSPDIPLLPRPPVLLRITPSCSSSYLLLPSSTYSTPPHLPYLDLHDSIPPTSFPLNPFTPPLSPYLPPPCSPLPHSHDHPSPAPVLSTPISHLPLPTRTLLPDPSLVPSVAPPHCPLLPLPPTLSLPPPLPTSPPRFSNISLLLLVPSPSRFPTVRPPPSSPPSPLPDQHSTSPTAPPALLPPASYYALSFHLLRRTRTLHEPSSSPLCVQASSPSFSSSLSFPSSLPLLCLSPPSTVLPSFTFPLPLLPSSIMSLSPCSLLYLLPLHATASSKTILASLPTDPPPLPPLYSPTLSFFPPYHLPHPQCLHASLASPAHRPPSQRCTSPPPPLSSLSPILLTSHPLPTSLPRYLRTYLPPSYTSCLSCPSHPRTSPSLSTNLHSVYQPFPIPSSPSSHSVRAHAIAPPFNTHHIPSRPPPTLHPSLHPLPSRPTSAPSPNDHLAQLLASTPTSLR
ncbi:unnamed protein product [Dicrocoelium dendriticum]|nr:unnamed protein product [Dicrocoelium dendriticum]